ncbi:hypothetical protein TBLA_0C04130 [Henningerozyma blattae CBS 6284]|uniref:arginyltransferase n=1 Tax=Henningerozyma blattae (strain ATCC 34711 / CBS 6284 / DSM 70876 / NBRC 10599 / NRRL Y-10934 / UCD 77-7) TaxID=1071380 RepID=I2H1G1_HENB6|nr:hypothetical protein TBLA_0C04130 [Tetrapisispora blattae CBS 6284]CCH60213.1 hypothetical protein TBLA_0C04130 [Tetrapisispora blattae CBS 6284]
MSANFANKLIITPPFYIKEPSTKCGYCHGKKDNTSDFISIAEENHNNCTIGLHSENMTIKQYDTLCNNNFRRSGTFLYKVDNLRNCCRLNTIRTSPNSFKLTKEFKKTIKRFAKFIEAPPIVNTSFDELICNLTNSKDFNFIFTKPDFSKEKFELFKRFQDSIHNDHDSTESGFKRFLCDNPFHNTLSYSQLNQLNNWQKNSNFKVAPYFGTIHECYYYKDNLIALAVLDIMPSGISSVYFIYDPDYKHYSLGKLSAIHELALTKRFGLDWYYMGYYIHDCIKMCYKSAYGQAELLDLKTHAYIPLDDITYNDRNKLFTYEKGSTINQAPIFYNNLNGTIIAEADESATILEEEYGIQCPPDDAFNEGVHNSLPRVVPGLIDLKDMLESLEREEELAPSLILYDSDNGRLRIYGGIDREGDELNLVAFNLKRLGMEDSIVII